MFSQNLTTKEMKQNNNEKKLCSNKNKPAKEESI